MAVNLGSSAVSLYLGSQAVNAYLGAVPVWTSVPTFTGAVDGEWTELANWVNGALPTSADSVIATGSITSNSGSAPTMVNFTLNAPVGVFLDLAIPITVTGIATFNRSSNNFENTITGNAIFNESSTNTSNATVTGNATFNDSSTNAGTVTGNATLNDSSTNDGTVSGTVTDNR